MSEAAAYGSVLDGAGRRIAAARVGEHVVDLADIDAELFSAGTLDAFLAAGAQRWTEVRGALDDALQADRVARTPLAGIRPVLAFTVADYVDFYASEHHATNAGRIFRPDAPEPLPGNWREMPLGYHGRAGSIVGSGTEIRRPSGMLGPGEFGPSRRLDFEAEVAFVVGVPGAEIAEADAAQHIFGMCLLNDWSARDIQAFETVPLGPFLGKSFATSIAAWITPLEAFAATAPVLEVRINDTVVSRPPFSLMHWTYGQMLAHLTSNGSRVRTGDVFASGTVSGPQREQRGCLLELTWNGTEPIRLDDGTFRTWLEDGDEVTIGAAAGSVELAEVRGRIVGSHRP